MSQLTESWVGIQPYIQMADWLTESELQKASVVWVVDHTTSWEVVTRMTKKGLPLLIPEINKELLAVCQQYNCGLYYRDAIDAAACIYYLMANYSDNSILGINSNAALFAEIRQ
jgi:hypothetical protein